MRQVEEFVVETVKHVVDRSSKGAFRSEDHIQGFFEGRAKEVLPSDCTYLPETRTMTRYARNPRGYLVPSERGRPGRIDAVIRCGPSWSVGIEMECPRGKGRTDPHNFMSHIHNDVLKLSNEDLSERYLLIFSYHSLPEGVTLDEVAAAASDVRLCYLRLAKQSENALASPVIEQRIAPERWVSI